MFFTNFSDSVTQICADAKDLMVRCGEWDIKNKDEIILHQDRVVEYIDIHPAYSYNGNIENDYALLHVKEDFILDDHISPICLPEVPGQRTGTYIIVCKAYFEHNHYTSVLHLRL